MKLKAIGFSSVVGICLLLIFLSGHSLMHADTGDTEWNFFAEDSYGAQWYLKNSLQAQEADMPMQLFVKYVPSEMNQRDAEGVEQYMKIEAMRFSTMLWELDCRAKKFRLLKVMLYDRSERLIDTNEFPRAVWCSTPPRSMPEKIVADVCGKNKQDSKDH